MYMVDNKKEEDLSVEENSTELPRFNFPIIKFYV